MTDCEKLKESKKRKTLCLRACVRVRVHVCVCERESKREREV